MPKKKKHAKHMTTDEAVKHLFHPDVVEHLKSTHELNERAEKALQKNEQLIGKPPKPKVN